MSFYDPIDPVDEQNILADIKGNIDAQKRLEETSNEDVAKRVSSIYRDAPYIPASVVLAMAKSGASPETVKTVAQLSGNQIVEKEKKKKKGFLEKFVWGPTKAASRWGTAALQLVPDLIQNTASQAFSKNDPPRS